MIRSLVCTTVLCLVIGTGATFAQTPAPAGQSSPAVRTNKADKEAISKACSDQANAKGLHGKERKKFRSACKGAGGKAV
jgi:hypothetical protein